MEILHSAMAGTLESSDVQITVIPAAELDITVESDVINQYGNHIKQFVLTVLNKLEIQHGEIRIVDKGALDCTIEARLKTAVYRAADKTVPEKWGE